MEIIDLRSRLVDALDREGAPSSDFDLNPNVELPEGRKLRQGAVLLGVMVDTQEVVLTKRAMHLKHHPGQVAFPGGKLDDDDASLEAAALREAQEEIGLDPNSVEVLGRLPSHETVTSFEVTPIVALIHSEQAFRPEPGEVDEVFRVPFSHVTDPTRFRIEGRYWRGQRRLYYTVPYGPYYIWGATARMLRGLADRLIP